MTQLAERPPFRFCLFLSSSGEGRMRYAREPEPPTARIDALYDRLAVLRDELERTPQDPGLKAEFTAVFDRLRTLQENEARQIRQRLEKSLFAPLGSGDRLLAQTRDLLKKHADPATPNAPAVETDTPEA